MPIMLRTLSRYRTTLTYGLPICVSCTSSPVLRFPQIWATTSSKLPVTRLSFAPRTLHTTSCPQSISSSTSSVPAPTLLYRIRYRRDGTRRSKALGTIIGFSIASIVFAISTWNTAYDLYRRAAALDIISQLQAHTYSNISALGLLQSIKTITTILAKATDPPPHLKYLPDIIEKYIKLHQAEMDNYEVDPLQLLLLPMSQEVLDTLRYVEFAKRNLVVCMKAMEFVIDVRLQELGPVVLVDYIMESVLEHLTVVARIAEDEEAGRLGDHVMGDKNRKEEEEKGKSDVQVIG
ncbi:hypothetical protein BDQ17DRAFT_1372818 [Cyathus striatus]|nr:hypothetical protein BDQ17DRAFT_1372818 [Cyathus striatus]